MSGLAIVATPIGNPADMSDRALQALREADAIICEEARVGGRLLSHFGIARPLLELNEHSDRTVTNELVQRLRAGESLALISDHGTPLLADPGQELVGKAIAAGITVTAVPGPSALLAGLVVSGLPIKRFRFVGLLPAKREERQAQLQHLRRERDTWVVFDTPYRLAALLEDLHAALGAERRISVACNLTMPDENVVRGTLQQVRDHFAASPFRGEFVLIVQGAVPEARPERAARDYPSRSRRFHSRR